MTRVDEFGSHPDRFKMNINMAEVPLMQQSWPPSLQPDSDLKQPDVVLIISGNCGAEGAQRHNPLNPRGFEL